MKRVYVTSDPVLAGQIESLLQTAGIACLLRNHYLGGAAGELPVNECWPEVWVIDDLDERAARRIIAQALEQPAAGAPWICAGCGERLEGQFTSCWKCGTARGD